LRASVLPTQGLEVGALLISPDGRTLAFAAVAGGQQQLYTWPLDALARDPQLRAVTSSAGGKNSVQWSPDSREVWYLEGGRITAITVESRQARTVAASAETDVAFDAEKRAVFDQARSYLANNFFDAGMNGVDWNGLALRVAPYVEGSRNPDDLRRVLSLMIGELNASHLGISGPTTGGVVIPMARLGVQLDRAALEAGGRYRIAEIIEQGPAAVAGLKVGDVVGAVDGVTLGAGAAPLDSLLLGKVGRRLTLTVTSGVPGTAAREVPVLTVSLGTEKALRYRQWVEQRRAYVARVSNGRLGYVHMFDMGQPSLDQLYLDLDAENQAREGVVVDVRNNNGGFVNPYAIDVLARRSYLLFTPRGSGTAPARASLGQRTIERPAVLVTNQHTLSDGEDFTEGFRALGLGKVVGEPTSGWIIFTSNVPLLDGSTLRIPFTRVTDAKGQALELKPRTTDILVIRPIGESYSGQDKQLDAAVRALLDGLPRKN
jgi:C-terminal processing protease CtpA/Prc